jgi:hypothetical protein
MHLRVRFIGKALEFLEAQGHDARRYPLQQVPAELVHVGDLVRHPLFPGRNLYVVARDVDLVDRCVTVWLDDLPGSGDAAAARAEESPYPSSAQALDD